MNKKKLRNATATILATLMLSACGEKSECDIPNRHVHKYVKEISEDISIEKYIDDEHLVNHGYNWTPTYVEINKNDEKFYKILNKKNLMVGTDNWNYLYNLMANNHDYLLFYYEYWTTEMYTTTDGKGNVEVHTRRVHHDGWHRDPYDSDNTGKTRLCHHRYYGYRLVNDENKIKLERSKSVDDIRDVISDYPYFEEDPTDIVYETYFYNNWELKYLSPYDFDVFTGPDLSTSELNLNKAKTIN